MFLGGPLTFKQGVMNSKSSLSKKSILNIQLICKTSVNIHNHLPLNSVFLINYIDFFHASILLQPYFVYSAIFFRKKFQGISITHFRHQMDTINQLGFKKTMLLKHEILSKQ